MSQRAYLSRKLSIDPGEILSPGSFEVNPEDRTLTDTELVAAAKDCDGLLSMLTDNLSAETLAQLPRLRVIAQHAVGVNNIDLAACAQRGIVVTHTPGVLTNATADLTMALILGLSRRVVEGDHLLRAGGFTGWSPTLLLGRALQGRTLGIFGYGRIGQAVAHRAKAFGMKIIFCSRRPVPQAAAEQVDFDDLLQRSDIISLHSPLTPETDKIFDAQRFAQMRAGALLINTARGPIVDEDALVAALESGHLGGAGLDVYSAEPEVHPGLINRSDVLLLPHLGSADEETRRRMAEMSLGDLRRVLDGKSPLHPVSAQP